MRTEFLMLASLFAAAVLISACIQSSVATGDASSNDIPTSSRRPTTTESLGLEAARLALVALIKESDDATLKIALPDLSKNPLDKKMEDAVVFLFGTTCEVNLSGRLWTVTISQSTSSWVYEGEFRRGEGGQWEALQVSEHERIFRNGKN